MTQFSSVIFVVVQGCW